MNRTDYQAVPARWRLSGKSETYDMKSKDSYDGGCCNTRYDNLWNGRDDFTYEEDGDDLKTHPVVKTIYNPSPAGFTYEPESYSMSIRPIVDPILIN